MYRKYTFMHKKIEANVKPLITIYGYIKNYTLTENLLFCEPKTTDQTHCNILLHIYGTQKKPCQLICCRTVIATAVSLLCLGLLSLRVSKQHAQEKHGEKKPRFWFHAKTTRAVRQQWRPDKDGKLCQGSAHEPSFWNLPPARHQPPPPQHTHTQKHSFVEVTSAERNKRGQKILFIMWSRVRLSP